jgi:hypothetical protein
MSGEIGIKYISIALLLILMADKKNQISRSSMQIEYLILFLLWPLIILYLSVVLYGNHYVKALIDGQIFILALFFYYMFNHQIYIKYVLHVLYRSSAILAALIIVINIYWILTSDIQTIQMLSQLFGESNIYLDLYNGQRDLSQYWVPRVYFRSTLFIVPGLVYYFGKNKLYAWICFLGLVLSFSKGGVLVVGIMFLIHLTYDKKQNGRYLMAAIFLVIILVTIQKLGSGIIEDYGSNNTIYNSFYTRNSHLDIYAHYFSSNISKFIFGGGMGGSLYSDWYRHNISKTEISQLDLLFKYGFIWTLFFTGFLFKSAYTSRNLINPLPLVAFVLASFTNNVLFAPLGLILILSSAKLSSAKLSRVL